jgi:uncharacterized membrane protein YfcA
MMKEDEFLKQQFLTLRAEIQASKRRALWILMLGIILAVAAAFLAAVEPKIFANAAIPLVLLVVILAFVVEQNSIIRAGRYIREHIEPSVQNVTGWERWLESNASYREVDRFFFGGFIIIFLGFYAISCTVSLDLFHDLKSALIAKCAGVTYGVGFLGVLFVLIRHWHSCTTTSDGDDEE